jgi:transcription elongation factor SPT4
VHALSKGKGSTFSLAFFCVSSGNLLGVLLKLLIHLPLPSHHLLPVACTPDSDCRGVEGWEAESHTSANFQGAIAVLAPRESWCARWQRIESFKPGVYALCVYGTINQEAREELGDNYRSRDTSKDLGT